ncbi:chemotaxis protein MotB [Nocardioides massiliensis]|uniref:Chemotaxis protein MotB n=1 Tax=Nocardioides massiliensis TaxID=1325935 RepID=A0ABT9NN78_9ACTN|nr:chemotaxis protein MotB [Nocardioides massiliensis]
MSYADMITVLMALFIVLYAMSQVDETKFEELKESLAAGFGSQADMRGSPAVLQGQGPAVMSAVMPMPVPAAEVQHQQDGVRPDLAAYVLDDPARRELGRQQQRRYAEASAEAERLADVARRITAALRRAGLADDVLMQVDERGLAISLVSEHVVFSADLATLTPRGTRVIDTLAPILRDLSDPLQIDGHTNQVDVRPKYYPTDWDLSSARAITVLRRLHEVGRVPQERMVASAHGKERPLLDPSHPRSQRVNKRVDVVVLSALDAESRQLLDEVSDLDIPGALGASPERRTPPSDKEVRP